MAKKKQTPRQRMINMMYIVLIAMLALNVDRYVLDAFHLMEKNFTSSAEQYDFKLSSQMSQFSAMLSDDEMKTKPFYEAAQEAKDVTQEFDSYIEDLKQELVTMYGGREENEDEPTSTELNALKTPEGLEKHANYFMVKEKGKKGIELQRKINETRDKLLALLHPKNSKLFVDENDFNQAKQANLLNASDEGLEENKTWTSTYLEYQPAGALLAMLTQYQNHAKALETDVIDKLMKEVNGTSFIIDELDAAIIPKSNYVMEGENYVADVMLIATTSGNNPKITTEGGEEIFMDGNVGKIEFRASGIGQKKIQGTIEVPDPKTGEPKKYNYEHEYQVFKPVATVSADAMKVLYKSLDNPLSISVPGFSTSDISVQASNGARITGSNGSYKVDVTGDVRKVEVSVFTKGRNMGTTSFRVRNVPAPDAMIGGIPNTGRAVSKQQLCAQSNILATLGQEFAYDLPFSVTSFRFIFQPRNAPARVIPVNGSRITPQMKALMCNARSGDRVFIEKIVAKNSQYGITRDVPPMMVVVR